MMFRRRRLAGKHVLIYSEPSAKRCDLQKTRTFNCVTNVLLSPGDICFHCELNRIANELIRPGLILNNSAGQRYIKRMQPEAKSVATRFHSSLHSKNHNILPTMKVVSATLIILRSIIKVVENI